MRGTIFHVPLGVAITPRDGRALCNRYWAYLPGRGLAFYTNLGLDDPAPQCNSSEAVIAHLIARLPELSGHRPVLVPVVFAANAREGATVAMHELRHRRAVARTREGVSCQCAICLGGAS